MAREAPISRGRRTVPRSISGTPNRRQNTPNTAPSAATRRSHQQATSSPPATAWPSTAAITGLPSRSRVHAHRAEVAVAVHRVAAALGDALQVGAGAEAPRRGPAGSRRPGASSASKALKAS